MEDLDHVVTKCLKLKKSIGVLRLWGFSIPEFLSFNSCLDELSIQLKRNALLVKMYFTLVWMLWIDRNKCMHGKKEDNVYVIAANTICMVSLESRSKLISDYWGADRSSGLLSVSWHPPPTDWIKINVDAALKSNYTAGIGGIIRECKGRFVLAFGFYGVHWDSAQLELHAFSSLREVMKGS